MAKVKPESRHNAISHGIFARILTSEPEKEDYRRLLEGVEEAIRPANGLEQVLVEKLAMLLLRLKRVYKADLDTAPAMFERVKDDLDLIQQLRQLRAINVQPIGKDSESTETETMAVAVNPTLLLQTEE